MNLLEAIELHLPRGYTVKEELGTGATSLVYLACCGDTGERLVVKVMLPGTVTSDTADRFIREMQMLKKLKHPRIVPILSPGEANGALFFTMPYVEGQSLRTMLQARGRLEVRKALLVARDIADALGYAHAQGVVHRDVKPDNILVARDGAAYLIDFGFADAPGLGGVGSTGAGMIVGTPTYMSPEQVSGKRADDWRGDFFSLGCVMYEMLAGQPPFAADSSREMMARRTTEAAPDVRVLRPDVPEAVAAIVRRNLDPYPSGRFAGATSLRVAIDAALEVLDD